MSASKGFIAQSDWQWFGHAAHLCVGQWCRFHLATLLPNGYFVSSVGEYWPERQVREIHANIHDPKWLVDHRSLKGDAFDDAYFRKFGYEEIGYLRKYETFVFTASLKEFCSCGCGLPHISNLSELDSLAANDAITARANHMEMCNKWANKPETEKP